MRASHIGAPHFGQLGCGIWGCERADMGEDYYPVPWPTLRYDTNLGGYLVNLTKGQLANAPKYSESQGWNWSRENDRLVGAAVAWPLAPLVQHGVTF
jgi:hypothetical protein